MTLHLPPPHFSTIRVSHPSQCTPTFGQKVEERENMALQNIYTHLLNISNKKNMPCPNFENCEKCAQREIIAASIMTCYYFRNTYYQW
jgi:hypothetical protein